MCIKIHITGIPILSLFVVASQISLNKDDKDSISNLPDDILIKILSLLDSKSAISTSILSRRWKNLYLSLTHFDLTLEKPNSHHDEKMIHFTKTILNLLDAHPNHNIRSLFIDLKYFRTKHKPLLDACVLNAFSGKFKLEHFELIHYGNLYRFPLDSLDGLGDSLQILHLSRCVLAQPRYLAFRSLRKFDFLINGCLNLEILCFIHSGLGGVLRIDAPFSHLKEIKYLHNFSWEIKIVCAPPKLESLDIYNSDFEVDIEPIMSQSDTEVKA
ncbi:hypothetical protein LUZ60_006707 [Juncus effusus]|nr:hypothetical protein LUZ60_006707 [Juncus effusus]